MGTDVRSVGEVAGRAPSEMFLSTKQPYDTGNLQISELSIFTYYQFGVSPVFVVDETPSPMNAQARIARFFLFSGVDIPGLLMAEKGYVKLAKGTNTPFQIGSKVVDDLMLGLDESLVKSKTSHYSFCGHPNIKRAHLKSTCEYCGTSNIQGLLKKARGF
ncbi:hypothetical protein NC653_006577 [Populus alba x Populus x berolinensis]|uniref:Uncharacterized protein n=1 Tax=Populus alba x Populus x berolinensis TaxID=444605 RepID=A0AAD6WCS8_9ROSI|nr:hypothetical protein NC653_006577 [Populus alba x Populus x berolinensis]